MSSPMRHWMEIEALIGLDAADTLRLHYGGTTLYVPRSPTPALLAILMPASAEKLCSAYGGDRVSVPIGERLDRLRAAHIRALTGRGLSRAEVARALGTTERTVYRALARAAGQKDQKENAHGPD